MANPPAKPHGFVRLRDVWISGALVALAIGSSLSAWRAPVQWTPDGLHYQSTLLQFRGMEEDAAIREAFAGPITSRLLASDETRRRLGDLELVRSTERFYERRRLLPALGSVIYPIFGERSLLVLSLVAYVLVAPLLYLVLRRRFAGAAVVAALFALALPELRLWSFFPLMDSAGLVLLLVAGFAAVSVLERGLRWLPLWCLALVALSVTREMYLAALVAVILLAIRRVPRSFVLSVSGGVAVLPAILFYRVPTQAFMDCTFNLSVCGDPSWSHVVAGYPASLGRMLVNDVFVHPIATGWFGLAALWLMRRTSHDDTYFSFWRGAFIGGLVTLTLLPNATDFRLELVLLPMAAVGTASYLASESWRSILHVWRARTAAVVRRGL